MSGIEIPAAGPEPGDPLCLLLVFKDESTVGAMVDLPLKFCGTPRAEMNSPLHCARHTLKRDRTQQRLDFFSLACGNVEKPVLLTGLVLNSQHVSTQRHRFAVRVPEVRDAVAVRVAGFRRDVKDPLVRKDQQ